MVDRRKVHSHLTALRDTSLDIKGPILSTDTNGQ